MSCMFCWTDIFIFSQNPQQKPAYFIQLPEEFDWLFILKKKTPSEMTATVNLHCFGFFFPLFFAEFVHVRQVLSTNGLFMPKNLIWTCVQIITGPVGSLTSDLNSVKLGDIWVTMALVFLSLTHEQREAQLAWGILVCGPLPWLEFKRWLIVPKRVMPLRYSATIGSPRWSQW